MVRWLVQHWVAMAFSMAVLLLALVPVLALTWDLPLLLVLAQLPLYMIHQVEEHAGDPSGRL